MAENYFAQKRRDRQQREGFAVKPADPKLPLETRRLANQADASAFDPAKAAADARIAQLEATIKAIEAQSAGAKNAIDLAIANTQLEKLRAELEQIKSGKNSALTALQGQLDRVNELFQQNIRGGAPNKFNLLVPDAFQRGTAAFDTAAQGLSNPFMSAFRVPGVGAQSDTELRQFLSANTPSQGDSDEVIEEKITNVQRRIDAERGIDKSSELPGVGSDWRSLPESQTETASGKFRAEVDSALKSVGVELGNRLATGESEASILKFMRDSGVDPKNTNIRQAFQVRRTKGFEQWRRQNPGKPYPIGDSFYTKQVPMSETRQIINKAVDSPIGAGVVSYLNAVTGGRLDNMSVNPEMMRTGLAAVRADQPLATLAGDVAGQATLEYAAGRIPGAKAIMAGKWGRRGADALYGAYSGSGEMDDNPLLGALGGAGVNTLFGGLGRGAQRGLGGVFTGVRNPNLSYLNDRGVPLSVGRIARGSDSTFGNAVGGIEERAAGLPIFDAIIGTERQRGDLGFNKSAFKEAADIVGRPATGDIGTPGLQDVGAMKRDAYRFLDPLSFPIDKRFAKGQSGIRAQVPGLVDLGDKVTKILDSTDRAFVGGALSGPRFQQVLRGIRSGRTGAAKENFGYEAANLLTDAEKNLVDFASRSAPTVANDLAKANRLYRYNKVLGDAVSSPLAQRSDQLFSAQGLNQASIAAQKRLKLDPNSSDRPFYDLTQAGMAVMPNLTPDSGTAGRSVMYSLLPSLLGGSIGAGAGAAYGGAADNMSAGQGAVAGGALGLGSTLVPTAILAGLYSEPLQRGIQKALLGKRPGPIQGLGEFLKKYPSLSGALGSSMGRDLLFQPEQPR